MRNREESVIIKKLGKTGEVMNEKIQISDLTIDNYTAKDAMKRVVEYLNTEALNIIEIVTLGTLEELANNEELQRQVSEFDITFAGDRAILEAAGIKDARSLRDAEPMLFIKMAMRFLHKYQVKVFLLAENGPNLIKLQEQFRETYSQAIIVGSATMEEHGASDDMMLNLVNGVEADCIISTLPSPMQEQFIIRNKSLLDAKLWLGLGNSFYMMKEGQSVFGRIKKLFARQILKKEIEFTSEPWPDNRNHNRRKGKIESPFNNIQYRNNEICIKQFNQTCFNQWKQKQINAAVKKQ